MVYFFIEPAAKFPQQILCVKSFNRFEDAKKKIRTKIKARTTRSMCEQIKTFTFIQIQNWNLCCLRADCRSDIWTSIWEKRRIYTCRLFVCVFAACDRRALISFYGQLTIFIFRLTTILFCKMSVVWVLAAANDLNRHLRLTHTTVHHRASSKLSKKHLHRL